MIATLVAASLLFGESPFSTPLAVAESFRLALTPKIDGQLSPFEWDSFSGTAERENYFQWEPGKIHFAGKIAENEALVLSLDTRNNGWLVGRDNFEVWITMDGEQPRMRLRRLDATLAAGPQWLGEPLLESVAQAKASRVESAWIVEATLNDPNLGLIPAGHEEKMGVRLENIVRDAVFEPYVPRTMAEAKFALDRGSSIPGGLRWKPELVARSVSQGSSIRIRLTFNGTNEMGLERISMDAKGIEAEATASMSMPFPKFDKKGRAFVDYATSIPEGVATGYRMLRAVVTDKSGNTAFLRSCFRIAGPVEVDLNRPDAMPVQDKPQKVRFGFYVRSNTGKRVEGTTTLILPEGWKQLTGDAKKFILANGYGAVRRVADVVAPAGVQGSFPIRVIAEYGGKTVETLEYVHFRAKE